MVGYHSYTKYLLSRRTTKRIIIFVLVTFIHNFFIFPARAAETADILPLSGPDASYIKSPSSTATRFERLVAAEKTPDSRPELVKSFKTLSPEAEKRLFPNNPAKANKKTKGVFNATSTEIDSSEIKARYFVTMTAYNAEVGQTDNDPCTTADGTKICKEVTPNIVAANFLPFGTKVKIPKLFGDRIFVVHDRTARKYSHRMDVLFKHRADALQFGKRQAEIVVVK